MQRGDVSLSTADAKIDSDSFAIASKIAEGRGARALRARRGLYRVAVQRDERVFVDFAEAG